MEKTVMTPAELAERWAISVATLANWRCAGRGPGFLKLGTKVVYPVDKVLAYEQANTKEGK